MEVIVKESWSNKCLLLLCMFSTLFYWIIVSLLPPLFFDSTTNSIDKKCHYLFVLLMMVQIWALYANFLRKTKEGEKSYFLFIASHNVLHKVINYFIICILSANIDFKTIKICLIIFFSIINLSHWFGLLTSFLTIGCIRSLGIPEIQFWFSSMHFYHSKRLAIKNSIFISVFNFCGYIPIGVLASILCSLNKLLAAISLSLTIACFLPFGLFLLYGIIYLIKKPEKCKDLVKAVENAGEVVCVILHILGCMTPFIIILVVLIKFAPSVNESS
jgi:hypothetical protein